MPTTAEYLTDLVAQRNALATHLTAQGVAAAATEKLNTLVPKVLQIDGTMHRACGLFTPTADTAAFSVGDLAFTPQRAAVFCGDAFLVAPETGRGLHGSLTINRSNTLCLSAMYRTADATLNGFATAGSAVFSAVTMRQGFFGISGMTIQGLPLYFAANKTYFWFACDSN